MASYPVRRKFIEQEYLTIERAADFKSEFLDGEMYARAGASRNHSRLQPNLMGEPYAALRGGTCEVFGSDFRIRVSDQAYFYPDIAVFCGLVGTTDREEDSALNPVAVFEIFSPSSEKYDRGLKSQHYRSVASLEDYILVSQEQMRVEQFTRQPDGTWKLRDHSPPMRN